MGLFKVYAFPLPFPEPALAEIVPQRIKFCYLATLENPHRINFAIWQPLENEIGWRTYAIRQNSFCGTTEQKWSFGPSFLFQRFGPPVFVSADDATE